MAAKGSTGGSKLIVNNLPNSFTEDDFTSMFSRYGKLASVHIATHKTTGQSLGYGFVVYLRALDAAKAIEEIDGLQLGRNKLRVSYSEPINDSLKNATKLYVKKLPFKFTEEDITALFSKYGKIVQTRLVRDSVTNKSKTVAYVFFDKWVDAQKAVTGLNGFTPEGAQKALEITFDEAKGLGAPVKFVRAQAAPYPQGGRPGSHGPHPKMGQSIPTHIASMGQGSVSVFVYNVGEFINEHELYNIFAPFGGLNKIDIARDAATQRCKGFAFLTFDNKKSAERAIQALDGTMYRGRPLQVRFKT